MNAKLIRACKSIPIENKTLSLNLVIVLLSEKLDGFHESLFK